MSAKVRVTGLREVTQALDEFATDLEDVKGFTDLATQAASTAARFAPKRSGRLASSIKPEVSKNRISVKVGAVYGGAINYGWRKRNIKPASFLEKADRDLTPKAVSALDRGIDDAIRKAGL